MGSRTRLRYNRIGRRALMNAFDNVHRDAGRFIASRAILNT